jgi:glycosyltransferase involved in cell wall biosynthesis
VGAQTRSLQIRRFGKITGFLHPTGFLFYFSAGDENDAVSGRLTLEATSRARRPGAGRRTRRFGAFFLPSRRLGAGDALVLPSVAEAFGLALVEAMACGLPVIACRTHGPAEIVADGRTGWLIPADDEDALVDALYTAADGQEQRRARGRRAQIDSRRYGWAEIAPRFASLYEELLASASSLQVARGARD